MNLTETGCVCLGHCCLDIVRLAVHIRDRYNFQTLQFPTYHRGQTMEYEFDRNMMYVLGTLLPVYRKVSGTYTEPL